MKSTSTEEETHIQVNLNFPLPSGSHRIKVVQNYFFFLLCFNTILLFFILFISFLHLEFNRQIYFKQHKIARTALETRSSSFEQVPGRERGHFPLKKKIVVLQSVRALHSSVLKFQYHFFPPPQFLRLRFTWQSSSKLRNGIQSYFRSLVFLLGLLKERRLSSEHSLQYMRSYLEIICG